LRSWPARVPMPMRRSFDGTLGEKAITTEDMALFAARFRQLHAEPDGPLAIVLPPAKHAGLVPLLGALAAADRPLWLFTTLRAARAWLDGPATGRCDA
jgi:hypothetical protein